MGLFSKLFLGIFGNSDNKYLLDTMRKVALNDNIQNRQKLYKALLKSKFLLPLASLPEGVEMNKLVTVTKEIGVQFIGERNTKGEEVFIAFTDVESLLRWRTGGCNYITLNAPDLFGMALKKNVVSIIVNCAGLTGGEITRREIILLVEGVVRTSLRTDNVDPVVIPPNTNIVVGAPAQPPAAELTDKLKEYCYSNSDIKTCYIFQMAIGGGQPHLTVGVEFSTLISKQKEMEFVQDIGKITHPFLGGKEYLDILNLTGSSFYSDVLKIIKPLFQR